MKNKAWLSQDWKDSNSGILVSIASQGRSQQQVGGRTGCGDCALGSLKGAPGRTESAGRESRVQERAPAICVIQ